MGAIFENDDCKLPKLIELSEEDHPVSKITYFYFVNIPISFSLENDRLLLRAKLDNLYEALEILNDSPIANITVGTLKKKLREEDRVKFNTI